METDIVKKIMTLMPTFSKSQKKIAQAILNDYNQTAYITAAKLGELVGVSESTVVRFAYELGYSKYPDFQHAVQKRVCVQMTSNQRIDATAARFGDSDILKSVMISDIEKIKFTMENIDRQAFSSSVEALVGAKRIYVIGARSSASLASFLNFNLGLIFDNIKFVQPTSTSEVFEQLLHIGPEDVMFAISFPRYSSKMVSAVDYAHAQGARVIALTDSMQSPIAPNATYVLTAQSDMVSYVDSLTAPLSIINAVLAAVAQSKRQEVKARFDELERVWDNYEVYAKQ